MPSGNKAGILAALLAAWLLAGCGRDERRFQDAAAGPQARAISQSDLHPGLLPVPRPAGNPLQGSATAGAEGRQLYVWFNCVGCHFNGGGGIGPPLMDEQWIYGSEPANIFSSIVEGRPNGMPAFRRQLTDRQVWQLVGYVRSLSELPDAPDRPERTRSQESPDAEKQQEPKGAG